MTRLWENGYDTCLRAHGAASVRAYWRHLMICDMEMKSYWNDMMDENHSWDGLKQWKTHEKNVGHCLNSNTCWQRLAKKWHLAIAKQNTHSTQTRLCACAVHDICLVHALYTSPFYGHLTFLWTPHFSMDAAPFYGHLTFLWTPHLSMDTSPFYGAWMARRALHYCSPTPHPTRCWYIGSENQSVCMFEFWFISFYIYIYIYIFEQHYLIWLHSFRCIAIPLQYLFLTIFGFEYLGLIHLAIFLGKKSKTLRGYSNFTFGLCWFWCPWFTLFVSDDLRSRLWFFWFYEFFLFEI